MLRSILLMSRPPLLCEEGNVLSHELAKLKLSHYPCSRRLFTLTRIFRVTYSRNQTRREDNMTPRDQAKRELESLTPVAGNGLLHRRAFLRGGATLVGAMSAYRLVPSASAQKLADDPWSLVPGAAVPDYGVRSRFEKNVVRTLSNPKAEARTQHARTPHHLLNGTFTPNALHFVISHAGDPDIDPERHRLVIHGLVKQPLVFTLDTLARYPMVSRMTFVECGGNSAPFFAKEPIQASVQALHGLVSCAEWTGIKLSTLLAETGIELKAKWFVAEGADAPALSRSVPVKKALDDAMIALYQNGERIMPGNGYPMRLLLPGYEGNMNVKFVRRIKLIDQPSMSYYETR